MHVDEGRLGNVVDVTAGPGDQPWVFAPLDRGADHLGYRHCEILPLVYETGAGALRSAPGAITLAAAWIDLTMLW